MQTEYEIYLDYQRSIGRADGLLVISSKVASRIQSEITSCRNQLAGGWTGNSAGDFLLKLNSLEEKGKNLAQRIAQIAEMQKTVAWNIYEAELNALAIARQRENG
ncbi:MAG: hypothetical protein Q4B26_08130 [Eubacteriales bacterium]|nr:hypothetical protein [Eubacteriales bacterium]